MLLGKKLNKKKVDTIGVMMAPRKKKEEKVEEVVEKVAEPAAEEKPKKRTKKKAENVVEVASENNAKQMSIEELAGSADVKKPRRRKKSFTIRATMYRRW